MTTGSVIGLVIVALFILAIVIFLLITSKAKGVSKATGKGGGITPKKPTKEITGPEKN